MTSQVGPRAQTNLGLPAIQEISPIARASADPAGNIIDTVAGWDRAGERHNSMADPFHVTSIGRLHGRQFQ